MRSNLRSCKGVQSGRGGKGWGQGSPAVTLDDSIPHQLLGDAHEPVQVHCFSGDHGKRPAGDAQPHAVPGSERGGVLPIKGYSATNPLLSAHDKGNDAWWLECRRQASSGHAEWQPTQSP